MADGWAAAKNVGLDRLVLALDVEHAAVAERILVGDLFVDSLAKMDTARHTVGLDTHEVMLNGQYTSVRTLAQTCVQRCLDTY